MKQRPESLFDLSVIETEIARSWLGLNPQKMMLKIEERVFLVDNDTLSMLEFEPSKQDVEHQIVYYLSVKETRSWKLERLIKNLSKKNRKMNIRKTLIL